MRVLVGAFGFRFQRVSAVRRVLASEGFQVSGLPAKEPRSHEGSFLN